MDQQAPKLGTAYCETFCLRDSLQILLLFSEFKRINNICSPLKSLENLWSSVDVK